MRQLVSELFIMSVDDAKLLQNALSLMLSTQS